MIGVESRKLKRAAASRVKLRKSPPVMVMPERETPGMTAKACRTPTVMASPRRDLRQRLLEFAHALGDPHDDGDDDEHGSDERGRAEGGLDVLLQQCAGKRGRDGCGDQEPQQLTLEALFFGREVAQVVAGLQRSERPCRPEPRG